MKRRDFIRSSAAVTAFHNFPYHLYAGTKKQASDRIKLGPMKVELSRLALGSGTNGSGGSSNQTKKLGVAGLADHYSAGFDRRHHFLGYGRPIRHRIRISARR